MAVVNVGTAITKAVNKLTGSLPRAQFVVWFNEVARDILNQPREWQFLQAPVSLAITNSQITIPATMSEITSIQVGLVFMTQGDQLTAEAAFIADQNQNTTNPGYTLDAAGVLTFHPTLAGTAIVTGETDLTADYADNAATIFPLAFENLFITGLRMHFYDKDKDGRFTKENKQYQLDMYKLKSWDNRHKPAIPYNRRGFNR